MGNLVKEIPLSEITSTFEVLAQHGVEREHFKKMRAVPDLAKRVSDTIIGHNTVVVSNWMLALLLREFKRHWLFFGAEFDLTAFAQTLKRYGRRQIAEWQKLGLDVAFLPAVLMAQAANFPGWKVKPEKWYYEVSDKGKLFLANTSGELVVSNPAYGLGGITVLIDTRCKPVYDNGRQMYEDDGKFLGSIIAGLRSAGAILDYTQGPRSSRFSVSPNEWEQHVKPAVAKLLKLKPEQVRLEKEIEANVIPQLCLDLPRKDDGKTNTWEWREEYFESRGGRLIGGSSGDGGVASVDYNDAGLHWDSFGLRPLAVL